MQVSHINQKLDDFNPLNCFKKVLVKVLYISIYKIDFINICDCLIIFDMAYVQESSIVIFCFIAAPKKVESYPGKDISPIIESTHKDKANTAIKEERSPSPSPSGRKHDTADGFGSPQKSPQLLGGKSTPLEVRKRPEAEKASDNQPSSSTTDGKRNIQKTVSAVQLDQAAGLTGLENFANNCYMNVVIQVLANIVELRDYFKSKFKF